MSEDKLNPEEINDAGLVTVGTSKFKHALCTALARVPADVARNAIANCLFAMPTAAGHGEYLPKELVQNRTIVTLSESLLDEDAADINWAILHQVAHFTLDHPPLVIGEVDYEFLEREANDLVWRWLDPIVYVRRQWNDPDTAQVRLSRLHALHWDKGTGGVWARSPQPFIYAYVWCTEVEGGIAHSCDYGPPPHQIKVCMVQKDNEDAVVERLQTLAGPKPKRSAKREKEEINELTGEVWLELTGEVGHLKIFSIILQDEYAAQIFPAVYVGEGVQHLVKLNLAKKTLGEFLNGTGIRDFCEVRLLTLANGKKVYERLR